MKSLRRNAATIFAAAAAFGALATSAARADLLLYEPFDYTSGDTLGGVDPDGAGPSFGTAVGKTNTYTGGGTWYARGSTSYSGPNDTVVSSGNLAYSGLSPSIGNSVSYGSATGSTALYGDSIDLPGAGISSGSVYASFVVRIKSQVGGTPVSGSLRNSIASFVTDASPPATLGQTLSGQQGSTTVTYPASFWMRRDTVVATTTNFSPSKSSSDGIGNGAVGDSTGWQSSSVAVLENNQFGARTGQTQPTFADPLTWQTYFVVLKYQFDTFADAASHNGQNDTVSLWMNPGSGTMGTPTGETDASQATTGNLGSYYAALNAYGTGALDVTTAINSFALIAHRQNLDQSIPVDVDELRIGTSWADVTPSGTYYWDINGATAGSGGPAPGGSWDNSTKNFNTDLNGGAGSLVAAPTQVETVVFGASNDATGSYTVSLTGPRTVAAVKIKDGDVTLSGGSISAGAYDVASGATGTISSTVTGAVSKTGSGTLTLTMDPTFTGGTSVSAGKLVVNRLQENNAVSITGGTLQVADSSPTLPSSPSGNNASVSRPSSLSIANDAAPLGSRVYNGTLDFGNNDLIIDYDATNPAADIEDMVRSGYNGGNWQGAGITSSTAANVLANGNYALAVADNNALTNKFGDDTGGKPKFSGQTVDDTTVLVKFTHRVDLDLDGLVTPNDAIIFATNYIQNGNGNWITGDVDYDGKHKQNDAIIFATFYNGTLPSLPEPGIVTAAIGAAGLLLRRRRA